MDFSEPTQEISHNLKCKNCGASLVFIPGTHNLACEFCKTTDEIIPEDDDTSIVSYDLVEFVANEEHPDNAIQSNVVKCPGCGASTTLPGNLTSAKCPFCTAPLVLDMVNAQNLVRPHYVLPFAVDKKQALANFSGWINNSWFTPSDLGKKSAVNSSGLVGIYLPHWTFDSDTLTSYAGKRGDYYYTTETYTEVVDGEERVCERQVRQTDWNWVSGTVEANFTDIMVSATKTISEKYDQILYPLDLKNLVHFDERYLSGFRSEAYQVKPEDGFNIAKLEMEPAIKRAIITDIGGDEQVIDSHQSEYTNMGVKYILLPVWISSFNYNNKVYQFMVNANTGEVIGKKPKSWTKIALLVLVIITLFVLIGAIELYYKVGQ